MTDRFLTVDGLLSSGAVIAVALFWDHGWSRAAATATVMALLRFGYWLYHWASPSPSAQTVPELERRLAQLERANGR